MGAENRPSVNPSTDVADLSPLQEDSMSTELRRMLWWALTTAHEEFGPFDGENVPRHWCAFEHYPDAGACHLHEEWVAAAQACGLLDDMAADSMSTETVITTPKGTV